MDYFFDIPVYRLAQNEYEAKQGAYIKSMMFETENHDQEAMMRGHHWTFYGGSWQFNEIIGYIRLHFLGTQIRGEWWTVDAKRVTRTRTKIFRYSGWKVVYEQEIPKGSTSKEIYRLLLLYLERAQKDKKLKRFYVDTSVFESIGPLVDWDAASKTLNGFRPSAAKKSKRKT
ncbi:MAG: hypothetical protein DME97_12000 [Verrucomicrobia bacterium]|nr:MAG: hypothetical protein DME97_12000 [Verrucomicrobiota bacterium]